MSQNWQDNNSQQNAGWNNPNYINNQQNLQGNNNWGAPQTGQNGWVL
jgi:hypothetical protein